MILDASAIVAVILAEPGYEGVLREMSEATLVAVDAQTLVEIAMALSSCLRSDAMPLLNEFLREADAEVVPFGQDHYEVALDAFSGTA